MGENPSTPPPQRQPARLDYGSDGVDGRKATVGSKVVLVLVWGLGLVSWAVWTGIIVYVVLRFVM